MFIFVFGSNKAGIHGAGAAQTARLTFGAAPGVGEGRTGLAYAIPTKDENFNVLSLSHIGESVHRFIEYAEFNPDLVFKVTQIGCGYAGYSPSDIAPLFTSAPNNCWFDTNWSEFLPENAKFWGTA